MTPELIVSGVGGLIVWTAAVAVVAWVMSANRKNRHWKRVYDGQVGLRVDAIEYGERRFQDGVRCGKSGSWTVVDLPDGTSRVCEVKKEAVK